MAINIPLLRRFVTDVGAMYDAAMKSTNYRISGVKFDGTNQCPFHLSACRRCGGASWQQPCPYCSYYPMGESYSFEEWERIKKTYELSFEEFEKILEKYDRNFATFYFWGEKKVQAYTTSFAYAKAVNHLIEQSKTMNVPDIQDIWDTVKQFQISQFWGEQLLDTEFEIHSRNGIWQVRGYLHQNEISGFSSKEEILEFVEPLIKSGRFPLLPNLEIKKQGSTWTIIRDYREVASGFLSYEAVEDYCQQLQISDLAAG